MIFVGVGRSEVLIRSQPAERAEARAGTVIGMAVGDQPARVKKTMVNRLHISDELATDSLRGRQPES